MDKDVIKAKKPLFYFIAIAIVVLTISILLSRMENANKQKASINKNNTAVTKKDSVVLYELPAISSSSNPSSESILMQVKYSGITPNAEILDVGLELSQPKKDGEYDYFLISKNNEQIRVTFYYKNGALENVRLSSVNLPYEASIAGMTTYTVVSKEGGEIIFQFHWTKDGVIDYVRVEPKVNPFNR
ncbi:MAG: hypothetical protein WCY05_03160 [Candidatus Omnitrophota bacterium]